MLERDAQLHELTTAVGSAVAQGRYVNAAGGAFRSGRLADADKYVAEGLRIAADGEFFAGQYRLRLTGAAVRASKGDWDRAVADLRELVGTPGEPAVMGALARSTLARLLARTGDAEARDVFAAALGDLAADDSIVAGPLAVAQVEMAWLDGSPADMTDEIRRALDLAEEAGHRSIQAELCAYLRRAGIELAGPVDAPGPWAPTLDGRWEEAATAWATLGDRYEQAVVLATAPDHRAHTQGLAMLRELGAVATVRAV